jgi:hypothetical protein
LTFDERRDERASRTFKQVALPMTRHGAIVDFGRPLSNGNGVDNLPLSRGAPSARARVTKVMLTPQLFEQVALQDAAALHEEAAVNRFR